MESQEGMADDTKWRLSQARYSKGNMAFRHLSGNGYKSRGDRLAEALRGHYSNREGAYILSPSKAAKLVKLLNDGWDASVITRELEPPDERERMTKGASMNRLGAVQELVTVAKLLAGNNRIAERVVHARGGLESTGLTERDLLPYFRKLERLVERYKKYERQMVMMRSAPDTSKFMAPHYGNLNAVMNSNIGYDYFVMGVQIGSKFAWTEQSGLSERDNWYAAYNEQQRVIKEFKAKARVIVEPLISMYGFRVFEKTGGSAWESWGITI